MKAIAAMSENRVIGRNGSLPWKIKEDLRLFKEKTLNKTIVVGRVTLYSLPRLDKRSCIALTRVVDMGVVPMVERNAAKFEKLFIRTSDSEDWNTIDERYGECFLCGGAQIYELLLPFCSELTLTTVKGACEGDAHMPPFDHLFVKENLIFESERFKVERFVKI